MSELSLPEYFPKSQLLTTFELLDFGILLTFLVLSDRSYCPLIAIIQSTSQKTAAAKESLTLNPRSCPSVRFMNSESGISGDLSMPLSRFLFSQTSIHLSKNVKHKADADAKQAIIMILAGV
jgi:hypothetical protein